MDPAGSPPAPDKSKDSESFSRVPTIPDNTDLTSDIIVSDTASIEEIVGVKISSHTPKVVSDVELPVTFRRLRKRCSSSFSSTPRASAIPTKGGKRYSDSSLNDYLIKKDKIGSSSLSDLSKVPAIAHPDVLEPAPDKVIFSHPPASTQNVHNIPALMDISTEELMPSIDLNNHSTMLSSLPPDIRQSINNRYRQGVCGPFTVFIEMIKSPIDGDSLTPPSVLGLGKALHFVPMLRPFMDIAFDLRKAGAFRYAISFLKHNSANEFVEKALLCAERIRLGEKWIIYIPDFRVKKRVVLFGIDDPDIDPSLIKENLNPTYNWKGTWVPPIAVELLKKKVFNENAKEGFKWVNGKTFVGTFENFELPSFVYLFGKKISLRPFVNKIIQCKHCLRFGHLDKTCRKIKEDPICYKCASPGHAGDNCVSSTNYCINCERGKLCDPTHPATSLKCPVLIHMKHVKKIMAVHCVGPIEAENFIRLSGIDTSDDPDIVSGPPPFTLEDFWPQLLQVPSAVSYAGAVSRNAVRRNASDTPPSEKVGIKYPTKNSKFLSNLHILRKKKVERIKKSAARDTPIHFKVNPEKDSPSLRPLLSASKRDSEIVTTPITQDSLKQKTTIYTSKDISLKNLSDINQSIYNSLSKSSNPMSKPLITFFLDHFASPAVAASEEATSSQLSLNIAHLTHLKNLFSEGLSLFNNLDI